MYIVINVTLEIWEGFYFILSKRINWKNPKYSLSRYIYILFIIIFKAFYLKSNISQQKRCSISFKVDLTLILYTLHSL